MKPVQIQARTGEARGHLLSPQKCHPPGTVCSAFLSRLHVLPACTYDPQFCAVPENDHFPYT